MLFADRVPIPYKTLVQTPPPKDWVGGAGALVAWKKLLGRPSRGGWMNETYYARTHTPPGEDPQSPARTRRRRRSAFTHTCMHARAHEKRTLAVADARRQSRYILSERVGETRQEEGRREGGRERQGEGK